MAFPAFKPFVNLSYVVCFMLNLCLIKRQRLKFLWFIFNFIIYKSKNNTNANYVDSICIHITFSYNIFWGRIRNIPSCRQQHSIVRKLMSLRWTSVQVDSILVNKYLFIEATSWNNEEKPSYLSPSQIIVHVWLFKSLLFKFDLI